MISLPDLAVVIYWSAPIHPIQSYRVSIRAICLLFHVIIGYRILSRFNSTAFCVNNMRMIISVHPPNLFIEKCNPRLSFTK